MELDLAVVIAELDLRIITQFDPVPRLYVAQCIDTGAIAVGATAREAEILMADILGADLRNALKDNSLKCMFHADVPWDRKREWYELETAEPFAVRTIVLKISLGRGQSDVSTEARFLVNERGKDSCTTSAA